jgi:endonuclease YncB( thermonuclease family)
MYRRLLALAAALAGTLVPAVPAAAAWTAPCLGRDGGPTCRFWSGKVTDVNDGDTIDVDIAGDHRRAYTIRFESLDAMEQTRYSFKHPERRRGLCHSLEATARTEQLLRRSHWRVRLSAQNPRARSGARLKRWVAVRVGGRWQDLGEKLMAEGHTIWMAPGDNWAWNRRYNAVGQQAAARRLRLWNPAACGQAYGAGVPLKLWVSWNPLGADQENVNGEWIKVQNRSASSAISLSRWFVRDSTHRRFSFPSGTELAPGATLTVYAGHGQASGLSFFWGLDNPPFQNFNDYRNQGDGGYLFDPQGNLRASMVYPCVYACSDPEQGSIRVLPHARDPEYVAFRNVASHPVDLYGYEMTVDGSRYDFGQGSVLAPGQTMRVYVQGDPADDSQFARFWGIDGRMLHDGGGFARLATFTDVTVACGSWGGGGC